MTSNEVLTAEPCPGHFQWSAFGASYPDTVCATILDWSEVPEGSPGATLCDADDDYRSGDIPCPMHDWARFWDYQFGEYYIPLCPVEEHRLPDGTEINFHDAQALWWSASCPDHGPQRILMRDMSETPGFDEDSFIDWSTTPPAVGEENDRG